jgi:cell wall assembly regulator SMI1
MTDMQIATLWTRIERWIAANVPAALSYLPAGASESTITNTEAVLGYPIPVELKAFLRIHDGSGNLWLHELGVFMSLKIVLTSWENEVDLWDDGDNDEWAHPNGPIKKRWFTRKWLPVLDAWSGDYTCVDLDPPEDGVHGQLISWFHDGGPREVAASGFRSLLEQYVKDLEVGLYLPMVNRQGQPYLHFNQSDA